MFQAVELDEAHDVLVICIDLRQEQADRCVERAVAFLQEHNMVA